LVGNSDPPVEVDVDGGDCIINESNWRRCCSNGDMVVPESVEAMEVVLLEVAVGELRGQDTAVSSILFIRVSIFAYPWNSPALLAPNMR